MMTSACKKKAGKLTWQSTNLIYLVGNFDFLAQLYQNIWNSR